MEDKNKHKNSNDESNKKKKDRKQKDLKNFQKLSPESEQKLCSSNKEHNSNEKKPVERKLSSENTTGNESVKNTKSILDCAKCLAERLSQSIISDSFQSLKEKNLLQNKPQRNILKVEVQVRQERVLPGIANNIVNLAIENAMQMIKAIKIYDRKKEIKNDSNDSSQIEIASQSLPKVKKDTNNLTKPATKVEKVANSDKVKDLDDKVTKKNNSTNKQTTDIKKEDKKEISESEHEIQDNETAALKKELDAKNKLPKKKKTSDIGKKDESVRPSKSKSKKGKKLKKQNIHEKENKELHKNENGNENQPVVNGVDDCKKSLHEKEEIVNDQGKEEEEREDTLDDWDANWTEDGECLSEDMKKEV